MMTSWTSAAVRASSRARSGSDRPRPIRGLRSPRHRGHLRAIMQEEVACACSRSSMWTTTT
eukprot:8840140-Heterocapsa_arctica.AAC.1